MDDEVLNNKNGLKDTENAFIEFKFPLLVFCMPLFVTGDLSYIEMAVGHHSSDGSTAAIHATTLECAVLGYANKDKLRENRSKILSKSLPMPQPKAPSRSVSCYQCVKIYQ